MYEHFTTHPGGMMYGLVKDIQVAARIAQAAKRCHLTVHNFDRADALIAHAKERKPVVILLDWDASEAESFKVLKELHQNADLKTVPSIGYVSGSKVNLKEEAQRAGCYRVYQKTDFLKQLEEIVARYT